MEQSNQQELFEFRNAMIELARSVGGRRQLDEADYTFYWKKLEDVNWPIVQAALDELGREMNWFPSVSIIRDRCRTLIESRRKAAYDTIMATCDHGTGNWQEVDVDGVKRLRKCDHVVAALAAAENVGKRLALPPPSSNPGEPS